MPSAAFSLLLNGYPIYPSTMMVARERINHVKWVEDFRLSEDFTFSLLNADAGEFVYIDKELAVITRHDNNASADFFEMAVSDVAVLEWARKSKRFNASKDRVIKVAMGSRLAGLGWSIRPKSRMKSLRYYFKSLSLPGSRLKAAKGIARTLFLI